MSSEYNESQTDFSEADDNTSNESAVSVYSESHTDFSEKDDNTLNQSDFSGSQTDNSELESMMSGYSRSKKKKRQSKSRRSKASGTGKRRHRCDKLLLFTLVVVLLLGGSAVAVYFLSFKPAQPNKDFRQLMKGNVTRLKGVYTWHEAKFLCEIYENHLYVPSENEQHDKCKGTWVGVFRDPKNSLNFYDVLFRRVSSTGLMWAVDQPNNYQNEENCVTMDRTGRLDDINCVFEKPVCCV